jgi:hypothetical protein
MRQLFHRLRLSANATIRNAKERRESETRWWSNEEFHDGSRQDGEGQDDVKNCGCKTEGVEGEVEGFFRQGKEPGRWRRI